MLSCMDQLKDGSNKERFSFKFLLNITEKDTRLQKKKNIQNDIELEIKGLQGNLKDNTKSCRLTRNTVNKTDTKQRQMDRKRPMRPKRRET